MRIFPDEIWADTHEPGLTPEERADGERYLAAMHDGADAEREAWRTLVARWTAPRAAYVVQAVLGGSTETRGESWTRAAQARLPERWLVRAYQGANVYSATSAPVRRPLALTLSPTSTPADRVQVSDGLAIDADVQWTVDFDAAVAAGMAVTLELGDPTAGVDLLLALGLTDSADAAAGAAQLRALLDAQHYTRGLAFLPPGTPTNNTPAAPAEFPPDDPGGARSFASERAAPLVDANSSPGTAGVAFAGALGLELAAVEHVEGAEREGDAAAAAMSDALWPATLGYFMEQLLAPLFDHDTIAAARRFWIDQVRPAGPLPAFRVGRVPYALLPAVSLGRLTGDPRFVPALRALRDRWFVPAATNAPHIASGSPDPDGDLLKVLALDASSRTLRIRLLLGQEVTSNAAGLLGSVAALEEQARLLQRVMARGALLASIGLTGQTRIGALDGPADDELLGGPFVTAGPTSEEFGLDGPDGQGFNYIRWLHDNATADLDAIRNDALPGHRRPLLYRVLRHALLAELDRLAFGHLTVANVVAAGDRAEPELVRLTSTETRLTSYERIDRAFVEPGFAGSLSPYLERLETLASLPTAELERRFGEALDACSHRLDAWITAAATHRLQALRRDAPSGCHVGGYGWVEDLRPASAQPSPGGYVHAPSAAHAGAAAILRNGYLSRGGAGSAYEVDLSSRRVRDALVLLDGTRQGEPLAALLGQRFERDLHERELERLISPLRDRFPLVAGKTPEGDGPTELVAAGNVVDGLALRRAWNEKSAPFDGDGSLPALSPGQLDALHAALDSLNGSVDAVADLLTAESIFQSVNGNTTASAASLDALAQGVQPPRPGIVGSPLGGTSFTQRLVVALAPGGGPAGQWGPPTPRALAEPALDHWLGTLLGSPARIGCRVLFPDGSPHEVRLDSLRLRPLDLVALARTPPSGLGEGELDRRVLDAAGAPAGAQVLYDASELEWSLAAALELARAAGELLAVARPLAPADLVVPAEAGSAATAADAEAALRAQAALERLDAVAQALASAHDADTLRSALGAGAALGVAGAYPPREADASALAALAAAAQKELAARRAAAPAPATDPAGAVRAVFGRDFLFLPHVAAPGPVAPASVAGEPHAPLRVLQQVARVRPNVGRWRSFWLYAQAFGTAPSLEVAQLPAAERWAGLPGAEIANGTLSLIVHRPTHALAASGWAGFVVDEWVETVPAPVQNTALSFRYEAPVAEAPQVVLLAVPPDSAAAWDEEALVDTVRDTLTLAKIRAVDGTLLEGLRPFLPAICLTGNTANETVSSDLLGAIVADPVVRAG